MSPVENDMLLEFGLLYVPQPYPLFTVIALAALAVWVNRERLISPAEMDESVKTDPMVNAKVLFLTNFNQIIDLLFPGVLPLVLFKLLFLFLVIICFCFLLSISKFGLISYITSTCCISIQDKCTPSFCDQT